MVGTIFEGSRTPLQLWFYAIFMFTTTRNGVAAKELQRQLGVTYKTAWRMTGFGAEESHAREHLGRVRRIPGSGAGRFPIRSASTTVALQAPARCHASIRAR